MYLDNAHSPPLSLCRLVHVLHSTSNWNSLWGKAFSYFLLLKKEENGRQFRLIVMLSFRVVTHRGHIIYRDNTVLYISATFQVMGPQLRHFSALKYSWKI
jgi:hypothetical protein